MTIERLKLLAGWFYKNRFLVFALTILEIAYFFFGATHYWLEIYWLYIYPEIRNQIVEAIWWLVILTTWFTGEIRWRGRLGLTIIMLVLMYIASIGGCYWQISKVKHVGSVQLGDHIYHLTSIEISGHYSILSECDKFGFFCREVDYFANFANDGEILADHSKNIIYVVRIKDNKTYEVIREYHPR